VARVANAKLHDVAAAFGERMNGALSGRRKIVLKGAAPA
jgi:hypothetical protein